MAVVSAFAVDLAAATDAERLGSMTSIVDLA